MKKKTVKKLVLSKETVRSLEDGALGNIAGGASLDELSCPDASCHPYRCPREILTWTCGC